MRKGGGGERGERRKSERKREEKNETERRRGGREGARERKGRMRKEETGRGGEGKVCVNTEALSNVRL